jgi:Na+-driven multidrug efflux pump
MLGMLSGSLVNIVLDYIFIFRMDMGMDGAALATCLAPFVSMGIMSIHIITGWNAFSLRLSLPSPKLIHEIVSLGLHSFFTEASGGIVILVFNFVIYRLLGNTGIAAYGVIANIGIVFTAIYIGISSGVQPLMCRYHGRKNTAAIRYLLKLSVVTALIFSAAAYALLFIQVSPVVGIFNSSSDKTLQAIAEHGLRLYFLFMPFMGINTILAVYFSSNEKPHTAQMISLLRGTLLVIPLVFLAYCLSSINLVWLTIPISELVTAAAGGAIFAFDLRKILSEDLKLAYR